MSSGRSVAVLLSSINVCIEVTEALYDVLVAVDTDLTVECNNSL